MFALVSGGVLGSVFNAGCFIFVFWIWLLIFRSWNFARFFRIVFIDFFLVQLVGGEWELYPTSDVVCSLIFDFSFWFRLKEFTTYELWSSKWGFKFLFRIFTKLIRGLIIEKCPDEKLFLASFIWKRRGFQSLWIKNTRIISRQSTKGKRKREKK